MIGQVSQIYFEHNVISLMLYSSTFGNSAVWLFKEFSIKRVIFFSFLFLDKNSIASKSKIWMVGNLPYKEVA